MGIRHGRVEVPQFPKRRPRHSMGRQIRLELWHLAAEELLVKSGGAQRMKNPKDPNVRRFFVWFSLYSLGISINIIWELVGFFYPRKFFFVFDDEGMIFYGSWEPVTFS